MKKSKFSVMKFKWVLIYDIVVGICSVISAVLITVMGYRPEQENIHLFLRIAPLFVAVWAFVTCALHLLFRGRINRILNTLQAIADGNLIITVDTNDDSECGIAYKNLSRVVNELKGSKREMQQFTNDFLHEFKTPITAIHGFAEHLISTGENIETPERMKFLKIIADESMRLSELSQKSLMLAKVEACEIITDKTEFDLSEQIKHCAILLLPQIEKKKIELDLDVENLTYCGDAELMEQVWINLISNAIKFTPEHGEISIKGFTSDDGITLTFSDSGSGMDSETCRRAFEKHYQGENSRNKGGYGIGLSIVHRITELCGGSITVESTENVGSTFTVFLPKK